MKKFFAGDCRRENIFHLVDPTEFMEMDFEAEVLLALNCLQPDYYCGVFTGAFMLEGQRHVSDLALVHKSFSHWFVVEVELAGHSLPHHVLPQVRCFRYGDPEPTCIASLLRAFDFLNVEQAKGILEHLPRFVAVIANLSDPTWVTALGALDVQLLTVAVYRNENGVTAREIEGKLTATAASLGFAQYSAIHQSLQISRTCGLPVGPIQIIDQFGTPSAWTVREDRNTLWITKDRGPALIAHNSYIQIIRTCEGRICFRPSGVGRLET